MMIQLLFNIYIYILITSTTTSASSTHVVQVIFVRRSRSQLYQVVCRVDFVLRHHLWVWLVFNIVVPSNLYQVLLNSYLGRSLHAQLVHQLGRDSPNGVLLASLSIGFSILGRELVTDNLQLLHVSLHSGSHPDQAGDCLS